MRNTKIVIGAISLALSFAIQSHSQTSLTNGLVTHFTFSGTATDLSGNGNHGNLQSGVGFTSDRFGNPNSALIFTNGATGEVTTTIQQPASDNFTLSIWFNIPQGTTVGMDGYHFLELKETQTGANFQVDKTLAFRSNAKLDFYVFSGAEVHLYSPSTVNDGMWHHAVATLSSEGMRLYLNGALVAQNPSVTTSEGFAGWFRLSQKLGMCDDVRIYNRALTSSEVANLHSIESPAPVTSLIKAVVPTFSNLVVGANYQLQVSSNLTSWTNEGASFTATNGELNYPTYFAVTNWNELFFRVQPAP